MNQTAMRGLVTNTVLNPSGVPRSKIVGKANASHHSSFRGSPGVPLTPLFAENLILKTHDPIPCAPV
jgi:hypothetical protein